MTVNNIDINYTSLSIQESSLTQGIGSVGASAPQGGGTVQQTGSISPASGDSVRISGPGQLFSQLQRLQSQNPTQFKQLASEIATQLQTASQQSTGHQATVLSNLANQFQTASQTGSLSSLQQSHHSHHAHGTYNQLGHVSAPPPIAVGASGSTGSTTASGGANLGQLFTTIAQEVSQALGVSGS